MNRTVFYPVLCMVCISTISCSNKVLFTQSYRERVASTDKNNVEKLQYYNDRDIELVYRSSTADESIAGGKVKFEDGLYVYTIEIKRKTPCIAKWYDNDRALKILFERDQYLVFRNFNEDTHYQLGGKKNDGVFQVEYEGKWFTPEKGSTARLLFVENRETRREEETRRAKGLKVE